MGNTQSSPDKAKAGRARRSLGAKFPYSLSPSKQRVKHISDTAAKADTANQNNGASATPAPDDAPPPNNVSPPDKIKEEGDGRPRTTSPDGPIEDLEPSSQLDLLALDVARTLSRPVSEASMVKSARSSTAQLPNVSQVSLVSGRTVDVQTAVALISELRKTASPEDLAALHRALAGSSKDSLPLQPSDYRPDATTAALIRSKSLAKPGIATRLPKSTEQSRPSSKASSPIHPTHTRPISKDRETPDLQPPTTEGFLDPPRPTGESRANTPTNLERSQLGSLKHGSLVIINGSDATDLRGPMPLLSRERGDEMEATSSSDASGSASPAFAQLGKESRNEEIGREDSGIDVESARSRRAAKKPSTADVRKTRSGSPLKREIRTESLESNGAADEGHPSDVRTSRSLVSLRASTKSRFSFEDGHSTDRGSTSSKTKRHEGKPTVLSDPSASAVSLAEEYIAELAPSPFDKEEFAPREAINKDPDAAAAAGAGAASPAARHQDAHVPLQTGSQHHHHDLEHHDLAHHDLAGDQLPAARASTSRSSDSQISPRRPLQSHPAEDPSSGDATNPVQPQTPVSVTKPGVATPSTVESAVSDVPPQRHANRLRLPSRLHSAGKDMPSTLTKVDRRSVVMYSSRAPDTAAGVEHKTVARIEEEAEKENKDDVSRRKSWRRSLRKSLPRLLSSSETSPASKNASVLSLVSELPASGDKKLGKKLQKRRRFSKPGPTRPSLEIDQADPHVWESGVPNVPTSVFARYTRRMQSTSAVEQIGKTHEARRLSRPVSASPSLERRPKSPTPDAHFADADDEVPPAPPKHRIGIGRNTFRRSKTDFIEPDISVADLGETAKSLGSSPYDVAMAATRLPGTASVGTRAQSHQTTDFESSPVRREGWDAATASRIMHERSKERAQRIMRAPSPAMADMFVYESSRDRAQRMDPGLDIRCPPLANQKPQSGLEGTQTPPGPGQRPSQQLPPPNRDQNPPHQVAQWSSPPFARPRSAFEPGLAPRMRMPIDQRPTHGNDIAGIQPDEISRPSSTAPERQLGPAGHERDSPRSILKQANRLSWQEGQYMRYPAEPIRRPRTTGPGPGSHRQVSPSMLQHKTRSWHPTEYYQPEPLHRPLANSDERVLAPVINRQQLPPRMQGPFNRRFMQAAGEPKYPPQPIQRADNTGPVKQLVTAYEQKVALETSPSRQPMQSRVPRPSRSPGPDWSDSSRQWRERRLNAQTQNLATADPVRIEAPAPHREVPSTDNLKATTAITMSPYGPRMTTTTVPDVVQEHHQHQHQQQQKQKEASTIPTETDQRPMMQTNNSMPEIHSVKLRKSISQINTQHANSSSQTTPSDRQPQPRRPSDRSQLPSQKQRSPRSAKHDRSAVFTENDIFGSYGGGARHCGATNFGPMDQAQVSPTTRAGCGFHGMDCGDVPYRVI